jgi:hypothetical protein
MQKKLEMQEMLAKSAAVVMGGNGDDQDQMENDFNGGGGLGGELRELEDMDNSYTGDNIGEGRETSGS